MCTHEKQKNRCKECGGSGLCTHGKQKNRCKECGGKGGVLMDRPPPRGAPWDLVWSANSQRPYLQKGRSHAHVKWRLCGRPRYGLMVCRATFSLESEGLIQDLRAIEAPCSLQGVHVHYAAACFCFTLHFIHCVLLFERCYAFDPGPHGLVVNDKQASGGSGICEHGKQRYACKECMSRGFSLAMGQSTQAIGSSEVRGAFSKVVVAAAAAGGQGQSANPICRRVRNA